MQLRQSHKNLLMKSGDPLGQKGLQWEGESGKETPLLAQAEAAFTLHKGFLDATNKKKKNALVYGISDTLAWYIIIWQANPMSMISANTDILS